MASGHASAEELLARLVTLEEQIRVLQRYLELYTDHLLNVKAAKSLAEKLTGGVPEADILFSGDRRANILLRGSIRDARVLVHVGLNYYVEAEPPLATRILSQKEKLVEEQLEKVRRELNERTRELRNVQEVLQAVIQRR